MVEFFRFMKRFWHAQRRRDGLTLLVVAVAFMIGWLRSITIREEVMIQSYGGDLSYLVRSHDGAIQWVCATWSRISGTREEVPLSIPYWSIVLPLTVLSAYFLLSKPRNISTNRDSKND